MSGVKITGKDLLIATVVFFTAGAAAGVGFTAVGGFTFGFNVAAGASAAALTLAGRVYARSQLGGGQNLSGTTARNTTNVRSTTEPRKIVYGEHIVGGSIVYIAADGDFLTLVLALADHVCDGYSSVKVDDRGFAKEEVRADGRVGVRPNFSLYEPFVGKLLFKFYDGTQVAAQPDIGGDFIGRDMTYAYLRLQKDSAVFPRGIPPISVLLRGKKVLDVRDGVRKYSVNPALILYDYMTTPTTELAPGVGISPADINTDDFIAAANICDQERGVAATEIEPIEIQRLLRDGTPETGFFIAEGFTLSIPFYRGQSIVLSRADGSTYPCYAIPSYYGDNTYQVWIFNVAATFDDAINNIRAPNENDLDYQFVSTDSRREKKFYGGGIIDTSTSRAEVLESMVEACAGRLSVVGGKWRFTAGAWTPPAADSVIDEDMLIEPIKAQPKVSTTNRFNIIRGTYAGFENQGVASDYQPYIEGHNDVREISLNKDFHFVQSQAAITTISKIHLRRQKYELIVSVSLNMAGMRYRPGDVVYINNERFGWQNKYFEVQSWTFKTKSQNRVPLTFVEMVLRETNPQIYDLADNEFVHTPADKTTLPNPFDVPLPTIDEIITNQVETTQGDYTLELVIEWSVPDEIDFANGGGNYELEWQITPADGVDDAWIAGSFVSASATRGVISQVSPLRDYDVRVRAINSFNVPSEWVERRKIQPTPTVVVRWDLGRIDESVGEVYDCGMTTEDVGRTLDLGTIAQ